jgi:hypothetical protein
MMRQLWSDLENRQFDQLSELAPTGQREHSRKPTSHTKLLLRHVRPDRSPNYGHAQGMDDVGQAEAAQAPLLTVNSKDFVNYFTALNLVSPT